MEQKPSPEAPWLIHFLLKFSILDQIHTSGSLASKCFRKVHNFGGGDKQRQEFWNGLPCPPPESLTNPGIDPVAPGSPVLTGRFFITVLPGKSSNIMVLYAAAEKNKVDVYADKE